MFVLLLVVLPPSTSCAPASSLFFSIECGRCSCSRSPAVLSYSLSFIMSSLTQGVDVRPPVLTSMLKLSWNTPLVCYCAAAFHVSSFDLLCFCFLKCAVIFCCCDVFSFDLCFCVLPCVMCFISFCGGGLFYCVNDLLVSFFELGQFNIDVFLLVRVHHTQSCHAFSF